MNHRVSNAARAFSHVSSLLLSLGVTLPACGGEPLSLGRNETENVWAACGDGNAGNYVADTQAEIDALAGCEVFDGNLTISVDSESLSLLPLSELRIVRDHLGISGVASLVGLEALQQVSGLTLDRLLASDLTPLRNLRSVAGYAAEDRLIVANLRIGSSPALRDLSGLENVSDWSALGVSGENLTSLAGLNAPPRVEEVSIHNAPLLEDVSALRPIIEAQFVSFGETGLTSLGDLGLRFADQIWLRDNPALTDLDGLSNLVRVESLLLENNDSLVRLDLPILDEVHLIAITGNDALPTIPVFDSGTGTGPYVAPGQPGDGLFTPFRHVAYLVGDNAALDSLVMPFGWAMVEEVVIWGNPNLRRIDLHFLQRSEELRIVENPVLDTVTAFGLERVGDLVVVNNAALSMTPFADVQTFTRVVSGNLDDLTTLP